MSQVKIQPNDVVKIWHPDESRKIQVFVDYVDEETGIFGYTLITDGKFDTRWAYLDQAQFIRKSYAQ